MDRITKEQRSAVMARVRGKNTRPELMVRRAAHSIGLRFRLHRRDLPGVPDLVFPKYKIALFVHGCFWHRHPGCKRATFPKSRKQFWSQKLNRNVERDALVMAKLERMGWRPVVVWECETKDSQKLATRLEGVFNRRKAKALPRQRRL